MDKVLGQHVIEFPTEGIDGQSSEHVTSPESDYFEEEAATKIQQTFRGYALRKNLSKMPISLKDRSVILDDMKHVNRLIEKSSTAQYVNGVPLEAILPLHAAIGGHQGSSPIECYKGFIDDRVGNCGDCAKLLYIFLKQNKNLSPELRAQVKVARLEYPDDHIFVIIGKLNSPDVMIVDPWIRYLNLPAKEGFRSKSVLATAKERERGFMGTKEEYKKFIKNHEDGNFLRKGGSHKIRIDTFSCDEDLQKEIVAHALDTEKRNA